MTNEKALDVIAHRCVEATRKLKQAEAALSEHIERHGPVHDDTPERKKLRRDRDLAKQELSVLLEDYAAVQKAQAIIRRLGGIAVGPAAPTCPVCGEKMTRAVDTFGCSSGSRWVCTEGHYPGMDA